MKIPVATATIVQNGKQRADASAYSTASNFTQDSHIHYSYGTIDDDHSPARAGDYSRDLERSSYSNFFRYQLTYSIPCHCLLLAAFYLLAIFAWPSMSTLPDEKRQYPHPIEWSELMLGALAFCSSELLKKPVFALLDSIHFINNAAVEPIFNSILQELLRAFVIFVSYRLDYRGIRFGKSLYMGLGWATLDLLFRTAELVRFVECYKDIMQSDEWEGASESSESDCESCASAELDRTGNGPTAIVPRCPSWDEEASATFGALVDSRRRYEIEQAYGKPFWLVPAPVVALWRLDSILLALSLTLFTSLSFLPEEQFYPILTTPIHSTIPPPHPARHPISIPLHITLPVSILVHATLSLLWTYGIKVRFLGVEGVSCMHPFPTKSEFDG